MDVRKGGGGGKNAENRVVFRCGVLSLLLALPGGWGYEEHNKNKAEISQSFLIIATPKLQTNNNQANKNINKARLIE